VGLKYCPEELHVPLAPHLIPFHPSELLASYQSNTTDINIDVPYSRCHMPPISSIIVMVNHIKCLAIVNKYYSSYPVLIQIKKEVIDYLDKGSFSVLWFLRKLARLP